MMPENETSRRGKKYWQLRRKMCSKLNGAIKLSGREAFYRFSVASFFYFSSPFNVKLYFHYARPYLSHYA